MGRRRIFCYFSFVGHKVNIVFEAVEEEHGDWVPWNGNYWLVKSLHLMSPLVVLSPYFLGRCAKEGFIGDTW